MKPRTVLVLYLVGLTCLAFATAGLPKALGLPWWGEFIGGVLIAVAYSWGSGFYAYLAAMTRAS